MTNAPCTQASAAPSFDELVMSGLPLVQYAVSDMRGRLPAHVDRDDLVSAGMLGLAQAARSWDPDRGVTFDRYARRRIQGALLDELRGLDWATRSVRAGARLLQAAGDLLAGSGGAAPTTEQLGRELGLPADAVRRLVAEVDRAKVQHYEVVVAEGTIPRSATTEDEPSCRLLQRELLGYLRDGIVSLPERLRTVVVEYYFEERQMQDIAADLGVTESRVSQMRSEAVGLLRAAIGGALDEAAPATVVPVGRAAARTAAYLAEVATASDLRSRLSAELPRAATRMAATA